jgi:hypothetical protein
MLPGKSLQYAALVVVISGLGGCQRWTTGTQPISPPSQPPIASSTPPSYDAAERYYQLGQRRAASARSIAESAVSPDDWRLVQQQWNGAIQALQAIPATHSRYPSAIALIALYQQELAKMPTQPITSTRPIERTPETLSVPLSAIADSSANTVMVVKPGKSPGTTLMYPNSNLINPPVFEVKVKRWFENRPLVTVTFNQAFQFEMMVDPKAATTQVTSTAAQLLALPITQQVVVNPQSSSFLAQGRIDSLQLGDITLNNPLITVGDENLQLGILGNDVLGNFQVSVEDGMIKFSLGSES